MNIEETYKVPGVYFREETLPHPHAAFRTGVPGFLGRVSRVPQDKQGLDLYEPVLIRRWPEFEIRFGHPLEGGFLAYAVRGFFENGGELCYIAPLAPNPDRKQSLKDGLDKLAQVSQLDLICAPDLMMAVEPGSLQSEAAKEVQELQNLVLAHCHGEVFSDGQAEPVRDQFPVGNRFAILDSLPGDDLGQTAGRWSELDGINGAIYYPWIQVSGLAPVQGRRVVPPCGHIAGVYARTDRLFGFHKPPANELLEGVIELVKGGRLSTAAQKESDPHGVVNCLRIFPGRGIRVWGARTISGQPQWRYVNVCRVVLTTVRWIEKNMFDVVFEPNNRSLWARIRRELASYLNDLFQRGALQGAMPWDAFYVKCDEETNPPESREIAEVVTEVGLAPALPNEFVVIRVIHSADGVSLMIR